MAPYTPLRRPRAYFEARGFLVRPALLAVTVAVLAVGGAFIGFAVLLEDRLRSAGHGDAAAAVWDVFVGYLFGIVVALFVGWVLAAAVTHLLARAFVGHDGEFTDTLAVVGWGTAPTVLTSLIAFAFLASALGDASMASPRTFTEQFERNLATSQFVQAAVSFVVAAWQTYFYGVGLSVAFDADYYRCAAVGGVVAYGGWLLSLF
ncbi:YIP1 family protein [Halobacterium yunchengense]|uniref:YIP1 family protein n=1 Tax=Halobacterium yunchengense TaxID=3108497 RepID=UPI00300A8C5D